MIPQHAVPYFTTKWSIFWTISAAVVVPAFVVGRSAFQLLCAEIFSVNVNHNTSTPVHPCGHALHSLVLLSRTGAAGPAVTSQLRKYIYID